MSDEIEILRHRVAVLERNLDRAREDHDKERRIMLERLRVAHEAIEAMRPLMVAKSQTVDVYDRARDAVDAYGRAPYVPESWYRPEKDDDCPDCDGFGVVHDTESCGCHGDDEKGHVSREPCPTCARPQDPKPDGWHEIRAVDARLERQAARAMAQVGKRRR